MFGVVQVFYIWTLLSQNFVCVCVDECVHVGVGVSVGVLVEAVV